MAKLRIGILGAAAIAPNAIVRPAQRSAGRPGRYPRATIHGIAARDVERARSFADRWSVPNVYATYDELLADPQIDAVYVPTPNGLHDRRAERRQARPVREAAHGQRG